MTKEEKEKKRKRNHKHKFIPLQLISSRNGPRSHVVIVCACGGYKEVATYEVFNKDIL